MADDDFFDDEAADFGEPMHPDDRLWRHPSELHSVPPPGSRSIPDTVDFAPVHRRRPPWGALAASSVVGAAVAVTVVMATGLGERVIERSAATTDPSPSTTVTTSTTAAPTTTVGPTGTTTSTTVAVEVPPPPDLSHAAATVAPSLVWITVVDEDGTTDCAGVVVRADGHLLTDSRPFTEGAAITVRFHDHTSATGELVGIDPLTELAVVHVDRHDLTPVPRGDPSLLRAGVPVLLLAPDPTGKATATTAMVNAVDTPARVDDHTTLYGMIQFDAPVPTELSGGPLVNPDGQVIGVTVRGGNGHPYGFATPIDAALVVADDLIDQGRARHPWLGIEGRQEGAEPMVLSVVEGSPAHLAGLRAADVILAVDGTPVPSMAAFVTAVRSRRPGDEITITYRRGDAEADCTAVLGER